MLISTCVPPLFMSSPGSSRRHNCHPRFVLNSRFNWENTTCVYHRACSVFVTRPSCFRHLQVRVGTCDEEFSAGSAGMWSLHVDLCSFWASAAVILTDLWPVSTCSSLAGGANKPRHILIRPPSVSDFLSSLGIPNLRPAWFHSHGHRWADPGRASYLEA